MAKNNYKKKKFSTKTIDFTPLTRIEKAKKVAKASRWPVAIGVTCALAVSVGMVIGSGGLVVPGAAFLGTFKSAMALWVKRLVITACSMVGFSIGFGLSRYFGIGQKKPKPSYASMAAHSYLDREQRHSPDLKSYRPLENALSTHGNQEIIAHSTLGNWLRIQPIGHPELAYSRQADDVYVPLETEQGVPYGNSFFTLTHYQRSTEKFLTNFEGRVFGYTEDEIDNFCTPYVPPISHTQAGLTRNFIGPGVAQNDANYAQICYDGGLKFK